jgi:hypothetical protein
MSVIMASGRLVAAALLAKICRPDYYGSFIARAAPSVTRRSYFLPRYHGRG